MGIFNITRNVLKCFYFYYLSLMRDCNGVGVIVYRIKKNEKEFLLYSQNTDKLFPNYWSPLVDEIKGEDIELYEKLRKKYGLITENMQSKLAAIRLLLEKGFCLVESIKDQNMQFIIDSNANNSELYKKIENMEMSLLNLLLHSMIPAGYNNYYSDEMDGRNYCTSEVNFFVYIAPINFNKKVLKTKGASFKWISLKKLKKLMETNDILISSHFYRFFNKMLATTNIFEVARSLENERVTAYGILNNVNRYVFLSPSYPNFALSNCYIIGNEEKFVIDPGASRLRDILPLIHYLDQNKSSIEGLILTHEHLAQYSQVNYLKDRYNIPLFASRNAAELLKQKENITVNFTIKEGDKLSLGTLNDEAWHLEVIECPGHTKGSICLYDKSRKILFSGGALLNTNLTFIDPDIGSLKEQFDTLNKLKKYPVKIALPSHGLWFMNYKKVITKNIHNYNLKINRIKKIIDSGYTQLREISKFLFDDDFDISAHVARLTALSFLNYLVEKKEIVRIGDDYLASKNK